MLGVAVPECVENEGRHSSPMEKNGYASFPSLVLFIYKVKYSKGRQSNLNQCSFDNELNSLCSAWEKNPQYLHGQRVLSMVSYSKCQPMASPRFSPLSASCSCCVSLCFVYLEVANRPQERARQPQVQGSPSSQLCTPVCRALRRAILLEP